MGAGGSRCFESMLCAALGGASARLRLGLASMALEKRWMYLEV